MDQLNRK